MTRGVPGSGYRNSYRDKIGLKTGCRVADVGSGEAALSKGSIGMRVSADSSLQLVAKGVIVRFVDLRYVATSSEGPQSSK